MQNIPLLDPRRDIVFKTIFSKDMEEASIARNSLISAFLAVCRTFRNTEFIISEKQVIMQT